MDSTAQQNTGAFAFVKELANDLNRGDIDLPSFPDIVLRIRQALEDDDSPTEKLVQLISAEPVLAARLLAVANSAALRPGGDPISDLNMAVMRLGRTMIRNSAMSFAMTQLEKAAKLETVRTRLETLWKQCAHVAALCYVLSRKYSGLNADEALFVGLVHGIGPMYIIVRAEAFPELFESEVDVVTVMEEWGAAIGRSIIESWGFADHVAEAVGEFRDTDRRHEGPADYCDILTVAYLVYEFVTAAEDAEIQLDNVAASGLLGITAADMIGVLKESEEKIASLRRALGN